MENCDHLWESGDIHSDFICSHCGKRSNLDDGLYTRCPACGEFLEICQGHDALKDPDGWDTVLAHDYGKHDNCHPMGCEERYMRT